MSIERARCGCLIVEVISSEMLEHSTYIPVCAANAMANLATALHNAAKTLSFDAPNDVDTSHHFTLKFKAKNGKVYQAINIQLQEVKP